MKILVAGGAGYIGSHTCVALIEAGHEVVIADNLCNSSGSVLADIAQITGIKPVFYQVDVADKKEVERVFSEQGLDGVIHFAGYKAVGESVDKPLKYYENNLLSTICLTEACLNHHVSRFIFSSSATVYGANPSPMTEEMHLLPAENPYGETKVISEKILTDVAKVNPAFSVVLLRYFNPVGAHKSGLIGESATTVPTNLMPRVVMAAKGEINNIKIFGGDYPTPDGTAVRDYIHVMDLAEGHVAALNHADEGIGIFNLGTGKGTSVLALIRAFENVNGVKVPHEITGRRPGDLGECYADTQKALRKLGFTARRDISEMCKDAWNYEKVRTTHF